MRRKVVALLVAAIATPALGEEVASKEDPERSAKPSAYVLPAALAIAGVGVVAALAGRHGGGAEGGTGGTRPGTPSGASGSPRSLIYSSPADFETPEYNAQPGLRQVKAASMYYNGNYAWYVGNAPDPAAGTGIGVKIAVADTGINPREGSTMSFISIDVAASYDYINNRPGAGADDYGHGTHVAGIIAAPKNGAGMQGLAYNATLVNFKVGNSTGAITASDAQLADMMSRAANAGAMIINGSWSSPNAITSFTTQDLQSSMPLMIDASRAYVAKGGVVVFAAGNNAAAQPGMQSGLPYRVSGIEPGWLAVVAIDDTGKIASYSNRCGVAAAWCLAAPGGSAQTGLLSMYNNGAYAYMYGTSMAAPHASAALAALKSMFVNLSYLQLRDRLLYTANRSGAYADASTYGQGLLDLEAASSPVGGVGVPVGASANGATVPVTGSAIAFPAGGVQALRMQSWVLVVDNYQRAPFWVPAGTFFREATPRLVERQWASLRSSPLAARVQTIGSGLRLSQAPGLNATLSADLGSYRIGFAQGAGGETSLGSQLGFATLPRLAAPGVDSAALGYAADLGAMRLGFVGTMPTASVTEARTVDSSSLGSRSAAGAVAQFGDGTTTYGVTLGLAERFERPLGIATSGAFDVGQSAALSSGAFVQHALGASTIVEGSLEIAHHRTQGELALSAPPFVMRSASLGARTALGAKTTLSAAFKRDWMGGAAQLNVPLTIAENG
ncbi:MAG TPA: S8 family peptidase, partial [Burkholderiales bacterium]|nr:S8 family peptidase [Burkholderiales bacterium]